MYYTLVQIDQLMQAFENLSFYEKRGQIKMQYIYEQYAYYIISIWKNKEIQEYIGMTRSQPSLCTSYINFEELYYEMESRMNNTDCNKNRGFSCSAL